MFPSGSSFDSNGGASIFNGEVFYSFPDCIVFVADVLSCTAIYLAVVGVRFSFKIGIIKFLFGHYPLHLLFLRWGSGRRIVR